MDENEGENVLDELNPQIDQGDNQSQHGHDQNQPRTLRDYMNPTRTGAPSCIVFPPEASRFNFKPGIIQLLPTFHGLESENPYLHLRDFEEVCNTYTDQNCSMNIIRLKLFPFSLKDKAKTWLQNLRSGSIRTRNNMQEQVLKKSFHLIEQFFLKGKSLLSLKKMEKHYTNVGIGLKSCLTYAHIMVLKLGDWSLTSTRA